MCLCVCRIEINVDHKSDKFRHLTESVCHASYCSKSSNDDSISTMEKYYMDKSMEGGGQRGQQRRVTSDTHHVVRSYFDDFLLDKVSFH